MFCVYVIKNQKNKIYIGQTVHIEERLKRHNGILKSKQGSYTKINKGEWKVVYQENYNTRQEVIKREKFLKSHVGRNWLKNGLVAQR